MVLFVLFVSLPSKSSRLLFKFGYANRNLLSGVFEELTAQITTNLTESWR